MDATVSCVHKATGTYIYRLRLARAARPRLRASASELRHVRSNDEREESRATAQKVQVLLTCELEETEKRASETVQFAAEGIVAVR